MKEINLHKKTNDPVLQNIMLFIFCGFAFFLLLLIPTGNSFAQRLTRDLNVDLLINQAGYVPDADKKVVVKGKATKNFEVIHTESREVVFEGSFKPENSDFGEYSAGDFSEITKEGNYYIKSDTLRSYPFRISGTVYDWPMNLILHYFSKQRCGPSATGYLSPCHSDDGIRMDNGKHQDVTGGWHDATDLRKWVDATIYGMVGLTKTYELLDENNLLKQKILEELMWGNQYFLKMQEPEGYVMNYVGGDVKKHADSNRWTDNEKGEEGGELHLAEPTTGKSTREMLIFGSNDDRVIRTDPAEFLAQYNFIASEAIMSRITKTKDPVYSRRCLQAAEKCFEWCKGKTHKVNPGILGASINAATELYHTTGNAAYKIFATEQASRLLELQANREQDPVSGFFYSSPEQLMPYKDIWHGCLELISVCDLINLFPSHKDVPLWKKMVENYTVNYQLFFSRKNSFGIIPYGLYSGEDPGGNRKAGNYWYRYFMQPELGWWVGVNTNLASAGIGLIKAARILNDSDLKSLSQRQLDWIIGCNPYNSSTFIGVGYNHPKRYIPGNAFRPYTPYLHGAVMNGLGGDEKDQPFIGNGHWQVSEYWTPMVAYTLWLMTEITTGQKDIRQ